MKINSFYRFAAALLLMLSLPACGSDDEPAAASGTEAGADAPADDPSNGDTPYVAIVSKGFQHQFWQAVRQGAESKADELGIEVTFEGPASESEVEAQITMLQNALTKEPDAIGFAALDSRVAGPILQQFDDAGIPVIAFDSGVESDIPLATAATDNLAAAAEAAKRMVELIGGSGKVGVIVHDQTSVTGQERRDGFLDYMAANAPDVEVLEVQYGGGDPTASADIAKAMIQANPELRGLYGANEGSAIGALQGARESGNTDVVVIGFDSGKAQTDAIRSGEMAGAITQNPFGMGEAVVQAAVDAMNGVDLPRSIDTGYYWYDASNIDDPQVAAVLYD